MSEVLLDPQAIALSLRRMAAEIVERGRRDRESAGEQPVIVGIRRGGDTLAKRLAALVGELAGEAPKVGAVDITLYRDDAATALPNPRIGPSRIPVSIDGRRVILVDDVLHTGRTIRAALDALMDFGRPRAIELAVLVDRGGRELPIAATYVGLDVDLAKDKRVEVMVKKKGPAEGDDEPWAILVPRPPVPMASPSSRGAAPPGAPPAGSRSGGDPR
ncbi:MAG TPA: bifunctional pyr operon transcriptional regulator/uracil phosphoribosyltransferase PyrR [Polyangiaceae bacterium]|jgi:pyrimidine operon attenuation protein/uracil phosphoribosyltransferase|nr:bifunctional pyr operon transcriptional regulator/uracil phosphoribosyltransferase PyrR [Polyangiaceae bacterium]